MTIDVVLQRVEDAVDNFGSAKAVAEQWGISSQCLCDIRKRKRKPGPAVLKALGLVLKESYEHKWKR
jgi:hypothetical protein